MKIILLNINEALSGQNKQTIREYANAIFSDVKNKIESQGKVVKKSFFKKFIELIGLDALKIFSTEKSEDVKLPQKEKIYNKLLKKYKKVTSKLYYTINIKQKEDYPTFQVGGFMNSSLRSDKDTLIFALNITVNLFFTENKQEDINFFRKKYNDIKREIYSAIEHELVHLKQGSDLNITKKSKLLTNSEMSRRHELIYKKIAPKSNEEKDVFDKYVLAPQSDDSHSHLSLFEIEAYAKGFYRSYIISRKTEKDLCLFLAKSATQYDIENELIIFFYLFVCRYIKNTYPNADMKGFDEGLEYLKKTYNQTELNLYL